MSIQIVEIAQPSVIDTVAVAQPSTVAVVEVRQGPVGPAGTGGDVIIDADTQSDGTADLLLLNVTTTTATVTGTLTADHIHGNLAGELYAHIRAGETLAKGDPVYISGSHGTGDALIAIASKADASDPAKMSAVGVMGADVAANANGHMVIAGTIPDLDTSGYAINAELYVAAGGGLTATPPAARAQPVARVERANANNGAILVKVNGLSASDATPSTLVRRDANGGASLEYPTFGSGFQITEAGGTDTFGMRSATADTWSMYGPDYGDFMSFSKAGGITFSPSGFAYGTGAAAAHRTALGLGTGDSPTFGGTGNNEVLIGAATVRVGQANQILLSGASGVSVLNARGFTFSGTGAGSGFFADAANTLAQRNGIGQPQTFRLYNTYTDSTNFERLNFRWSGNTAFIGTEKGSAGGTARDLVLETDGTERVRVTAAGAVTMGGTLAATGAISSSGSISTTAGIIAGQTQAFSFSGRSRMLSDADGTMRLTNAAISVGVALDFATDGTLKIRSRANSADANLSAANLTASGDIEATDSASGVILKSPNGTRWRVTVDNTGALVTTSPP